MRLFSGLKRAFDFTLSHHGGLEFRPRAVKVSLELCRLTYVPGKFGVLVLFEPVLSLASVEIGI